MNLYFILSLYFLIQNKCANLIIANAIAKGADRKEDFAKLLTFNFDCLNLIKGTFSFFKGLIRFIIFLEE